ncbi:hypothetical protein Ae168Ps1_5090c [Pseudonocardia sp. Ae168_Ps1]|uniref:hypothetical protein n=1 Tax=unclassified Pseudonocardia TaxID=2619320 RepID=UPI0001FFDFAC|nr:MULTISPECIES: hypothetical protein [unclassified Pseudonocardia]OLL76673.1 hypothetical protein Ae150APs1_5051c [Pseudonocardia sp. Ae150A_Ps1]OLL82684.1 hypothetical protein Ae168Ps1_5090c [Pseudonocardia sp. Ae168_Ps1]OLL83203.1 hypothetical protein Ae263Ps1_0258 [Pseudonocardia sp. Ae263_Ps1]OLL90759.1 hypothetical protein Ae356Ps1_0656c [Pseudonocardia sp. Ae356_Ps1]OLM17203.1 hypothetical protein Ae707Ps1_1462c [Pseudonocardia sp. Ae707_Ps1]
MDDLERETLDILRMGPETLDELAGMYAAADEVRLTARGGSVRAGTEDVVRRLAERGLVAQAGPASGWQLTDTGRRLAGERTG